MQILRNFPAYSADNIYGRPATKAMAGGGIWDGGSMKYWRLVIVLIVVLVAVGSVSKVFHRIPNACVAEEDSSSSDDGGDDSDYTEFA